MYGKHFSRESRQCTANGKRAATTTNKIQQMKDTYLSKPGRSCAPLELV